MNHSFPRGGGALLVFATTAAAYVWYFHWHGPRETKKRRNRSLGSNQELDADAIRQIVSTLYNVQVRNCTRTPTLAGANHNYSIETSDDQYVLRVYWNDKYYIRDGDDFGFELDLIHHLHEQGGPVAGVVPAKNGDWRIEIRFNERGEIDPEAPFCRHAALLRVPPGVPVSQLNRRSRGTFLGPNQFYTLGRTMARLHRLADGFPNPHRHYRYRQDVDTFLLDQPLQQLVTWGMAGQLDFFRPTAQRLRQWVARLQTQHQKAPYYGILHGDIHSGNLVCQVEERQFFVVEWDRCCYGWRVSEFAWLSARIPPTNFEALVRGYDSVRPLIPIERTLIPVFALLRELWDMGDVLALAPLSAEGRPTGRQLNRYLERLRYIQQKVNEMEDPAVVVELPARAEPPDPLPAPVVPAPIPLPIPVPVYRSQRVVVPARAPVPAPAPAPFPAQHSLT